MFEAKRELHDSTRTPTVGALLGTAFSSVCRWTAPEVTTSRDENQLRPCRAQATMQAILRNPKYTGFNVWNRHDKREGCAVRSRRGAPPPGGRPSVMRGEGCRHRARRCGRRIVTCR